MTEMNNSGEVAARYTEFSRYLLPLAAEREEVTVQKDRHLRYQLPSPTTGRVTTYTRATKLAKTISDSSKLEAWKIREKVAAVAKAQAISIDLKTSRSKKVGDKYSDSELAMAAVYNEYEANNLDAKGYEVNSYIDLMHNLAGGSDAAELGTAVHDWLAELDMGRVLFHQLPDYIKPYAVSYQDALAKAGLVPVAEYTERVVLNDRGVETIAGRIDRVYRVVETNEMVLGDVKTSKMSSIDFAKVDWAIQFAVYGYATKMLNLDGLTWSDMPTLNQDYCVVVHLPSDQPDRAAVVPFDLYAGGEGMIAAITVRQQRSSIAKRAMSPVLESPSEATIRYVEARQAIQNITTADDAVAIREQYEEVWTDDLTEFGAAAFELLTATERNN